MAGDKKLTKKELKSLKFKAKKSEKAAKELKTVQENAKEQEKLKKEKLVQAQAPKKKRKTRRGHHGRGKNHSQSGPRFILFVGNLPYETTEKDLKEHFKVGSPDLIRVRKDKGIAFMEFLTAKGHIQGRIDACLALHHSMIKNRRINVELTAGGGGNSKHRVEKIKKKNEKLMKEKSEKIRKERMNKAKNNEESAETKMAEEALDNSGINPSRLAMIKRGMH